MAQIHEVEIVENFVANQEPKELQEIPNKIRFLVEGSPNLESKIATLQKFYPKVEVDTLQNNNFIVTDDSGRQFQLDNKKEFTFGDVIDVGKEITEIIGAIGGATTGNYRWYCCCSWRWYSCRCCNRCRCRYSCRCRNI